MTRAWLSRWLTFIAIASCMVGNVLIAQSDEESFDLEVHDISVWIGDPAAKKLNSTNRFASGLPSLIDSPRKALRSSDVFLVPIGLLTFYGASVEEADVELALTGGRFVTNWPKARRRSTRLRWLSVAMDAELKTENLIMDLPRDHWFDVARQFPALYVRTENRVERFIAYDAELNQNAFLTIDGDPKRYQLKNLTEFPLLDICVVDPRNDGVRIGWLDSLPPKPKAPETDEKGEKNEKEKPENKQVSDNDEGGPPPSEGEPSPPPSTRAEEAAEKPVDSPTAVKQPPPQEPTELVMSDPVQRSDVNWASMSANEWAKRLSATGLKQEEINLLTSLYSQAIFESKQMIILARFAPGYLDQQIPLDIYPGFDKAVRVGCLVLLNMDPSSRANIDSLIADLGAEEFKQRDAAEKQLTKLGNMAFEKLRKALDAKDPEIMYRVERILLYQGQPVEIKKEADKDKGSD